MNKELCRGGNPKYAEARSNLLDSMRKSAGDIQLQKEEDWFRAINTNPGKDERSTKPVDGVHKVASLEGQDLRTKTTSAPTQDSLAQESRNLRETQKAADFHFNSSPTIQNISPKMSTTKGSLPKMASQRLLTDPLIQYLRKEAKQDTFEIDSGSSSQLPTNVNEMERNPPTEKLVAEDPNPDATLEESVPETYAYLRRMFSNSDFRKKFKDKELGDKDNG